MERNVGELELKVLREVCRVIGQALDLERALVVILQTLFELFAAKRATIILRHEGVNLSLVCNSHGAKTHVERTEMSDDEARFIGRILRSAQPFVLSNLKREPLPVGKIGTCALNKTNIIALGTPIILDGEAVGALSVDRLFADEVSLEGEMGFLSLLATLIAEFVSLNRQAKRREDELRRENISNIAKMPQDYLRLFVVGKSLGMMQVWEQIERAAPSNVPVLLLGESGTGKTLVARIIHEFSRSTERPFVELNCVSPSVTLLESRLFVRGAAKDTGASTTGAGRLNTGATLFLNEIADLSLPLQGRLLKFLRDLETETLGNAKTGRSDVRLIAATSRDLSEEVKEGRFREDLYYRLDVFPIRIPPLRERREDIPLLLNHLLESYRNEYARRLRITPQALDVLVNYHWPGNMTEMKNLVQHLMITVNGASIQTGDLPMVSGEEMAGKDEQDSLSRLELMERKEVVTALARNNWFQSRTARELGLTFRQMNYRVKKFGLERLIMEHRSRMTSGLKKSG